MAAPIVANPGQNLSQDDWNALVAQHGGTKSVSPRAMTEDEIKAAALAKDEDPSGQQRPVYVYYFNDGSYVETRTTPDGQSSQVLSYKPSAQFTQNPANKPGAAGTKPSIPPGGSSSTEGTPLPDGTWDNSRPRQVIKDKDGNVVWSEELQGADLTAWRNNQQANQTQTAEQRQAVPNRPGWTAVTRVTTQGGNKTETTTYIGPDGQEVSSLPAEQPKDTPTVITRNGTTYIQHTTPGADGKPGEIYYTDQNGNRVTLPPEQKPETTTVVTGSDGKTYIRHVVPKADGTNDVYHTDQQGNRVQLPNEPSKGTPPEPAGAPPVDTTYGQTTASLVKYRDFLNEEVKGERKLPDGTIQRFTPTLTPDQADRLMQARLTQVEATTREQQGVVNTQTGIYGQQITEAQNERTDANNRRTQANSAYSTVMQSFVPLLKYMPKGGGQAFLDLLAHGMGAARQNAADWGGMKETPAPTLGPAAAAANAASMPGTQGTFLAGAIPPNAIGAGSVGAVPAPGAPIGQVANGVTATNAAAINPTGANVQAATDATMQGSNAAFGALGIPAQQATPPAVNPAAGEPGHNPNAPVGMLPTGAQSFLAPYQQQQQQPSALDQLLNDPWLPNDVVARAYQDVHGVPMSSYGMS